MESSEAAPAEADTDIPIRLSRRAAQPDHAALERPDRSKRYRMVFRSGWAFRARKSRNRVQITRDAPTAASLNWIRAAALPWALFGCVLPSRARMRAKAVSLSSIRASSPVLSSSSVLECSPCESSGAESSSPWSIWHANRSASISRRSRSIAISFSFRTS